MVTGVDVAAVERIAALVERRPRFLSKLFTPDEVEYCAGRPERLAARWAAKEAVRKVHGGLGLPLPPYSAIAVRHRAGGAPEIVVNGRVIQGLEVSLSHDAGIAIAVAVMAAVEPPLELPQGLVLPDRPADGHKGTFGTVLVVAGSPTFPGAAVLACRGALRGGAGRVRCVVGMGDSVSSLPAEVIRVPVRTEGSAFAAAELQGFLSRAGAETWVCGPGLGAGEGVAALVETVLTSRPATARTGDPRAGLVLDADALNSISRERRFLELIPHDSVITPHPLEAARLLGTDVGEVQRDRRGAARELAFRTGAISVLKGAMTVVASPDGDVWTDAHATPALAVGGAGDVLSGLVGALMAQGLAAAEAARCGVFLHGEAGTRLERRRGRAGILASEVADELVETQEVARAASRRR